MAFEIWIDNAVFKPVGNFEYPYRVGNYSRSHCCLNDQNSRFYLSINADLQPESGAVFTFHLSIYLDCFQPECKCITACPQPSTGGLMEFWLIHETNIMVIIKDKVKERKKKILHFKSRYFIIISFVSVSVFFCFFSFFVLFCFVFFGLFLWWCSIHLSIYLHSNKIKMVSNIW